MNQGGDENVVVCSYLPPSGARKGPDAEISTVHLGTLQLTTKSADWNLTYTGAEIPSVDTALGTSTVKACSTLALYCIKTGL